MHFLGLSDAVFIELQPGSGLEERQQAAVKCDVWNRMMGTRVKAVDDVVDEVFVVHRSPKIREPVRHDLHAGAVVEDVEVTLVEVVELGTKVDGAGVLVVTKEVPNATPDGVGGVGVLRDHGEELGRDTVVEPGSDGAVVLHPIVVALSRSVVDMITKPVPTEDGGQGASPGDVVRVIEIKDDRHAIQDVDVVDDRRGTDSVWTWTV